MKVLALADELFAELSMQIEDAGHIPRQGLILDPRMVAAPCQRNGRKENATIKEGETPEDWKDKHAKLQQRDVEARWTKKHGNTYYGHMNHICADNVHKLVHHFEVTDAAVHDSRVLDFLLDPTNTSADIWADSAYRSKERKARLKADGYRSHILTKGSAKRPLSARATKAIHLRIMTRARVEHAFGALCTMGGMLVRTFGLTRARIMF